MKVPLREDAVTSFLQMKVKKKLSRFNSTTDIFTFNDDSHREHETGSDFEITYQPSMGNLIGYTIQAKVAKVNDKGTVVVKKFAHTVKKINKLQIDLLEQHSTKTGLRAFYLIYIGLDKGPGVIPWLPTGRARKDYGCTAIDLASVRTEMFRKPAPPNGNLPHKTIRLDAFKQSALPWHELFTPALFRKTPLIGPSSKITRVPWYTETLHYLNEKYPTIDDQISITTKIEDSVIDGTLTYDGMDLHNFYTLLRWVFPEVRELPEFDWLEKSVTKYDLGLKHRLQLLHEYAKIKGLNDHDNPFPDFTMLSLTFPRRILHIVDQEEAPVESNHVPTT